MSIKEPRDPKPFDFRLRGHGHDIAAGTFNADCEEDAFKLAMQKCKGFTLPGWELFCATTGNGQSVVQFYDGTRTDDKGRPERVRL